MKGELLAWCVNRYTSEGMAKLIYRGGNKFQLEIPLSYTDPAYLDMTMNLPGWPRLLYDLVRSSLVIYVEKVYAVIEDEAEKVAWMKDKNLNRYNNNK